jgi:hypothetical protein
MKRTPIVFLIISLLVAAGNVYSQIAFNEDE